MRTKVTFFCLPPLLFAYSCSAPSGPEGQAESSASETESSESAISSSGDAPRQGRGNGGADSSSSAENEGGDAGGRARAQSVAAHVRAVSASGSEGSYSLSVTVESDDLDCSQFCNFWEVIDESGRLLYRRNLDHSHTDENGTSDAGSKGNTFTRSGGPVVIEADQFIIIRAHMNTGGYQGDVMSGSINAGFIVNDELPMGMFAELEFAEPLSDLCLF